jgi:hypothetical protein
VSPRRKTQVASSLIRAAIVTIPFFLLAASPQAVAATPTCFGRSPTLVGTEERDVLRGTPGDDIIVGLGGRDFIRGNEGRDLLCGGPVATY